MTFIPRPTVLVVDDNRMNIDLMIDLLKDDFELLAALNGEAALEIIQNTLPDIILLDIMMPDMDGYEVCKRLKSEERTNKIPVIFITAKAQIEDEAKGLKYGAVDYITKPISPPIVKARIATHLSLAQQQRSCEAQIVKQIAEISKGQKDAVFMLGKAGHFNDDDTGNHIWRMADYAKALAKAVGWSVKEQNMLQLAAAMHDSGKIGISDSILKKPGKLDEDEWITMRKHTEFGHQVLSIADSPLFLMASEVALHHHERWAGGGYPADLQGEDIPEAARIVALADVFDALTIKRPYKKAWPIEKAMEYIGNSDGHFEPRLAKLFLSIESEIRAIKEYWDQKGSSGQSVL